MGEAKKVALIHALEESKQPVWESKPTDQQVIGQKKKLMDHLEAVEMSK